MNLFLPDTHAIYWYEFRHPRLSKDADQAFKDAEAGAAQLLIHPVVLAEFHWLLRKGSPLRGLGPPFSPVTPRSRPVGK